jgi:molybdopterin-binding protein
VISAPRAGHPGVGSLPAAATASEAARALGIGLDTLRRWDRQGRIEVELDVTEHARLVVVITRDAAEELGVRAGMSAVVKATSVMVER